MIGARDLVLTLGGRRVLDGVSFSVARGEAVALVGPNGSGKTSVLRCLLGLVPYSGQARIDGHPVDLLLDTGALDVNAREGLTGSTLLHKLARYGVAAWLAAWLVQQRGAMGQGNGAPATMAQPDVENLAQPAGEDEGEK